MTTEERLECIGRLTAGIAEERRKDRDEYKALWRETQRQLDQAARALADLAATHIALTRDVAEIGIHIRDLTEEARDAGRRTDERIAALVSALGEHLRQGHTAEPQ